MAKLVFAEYDFSRDSLNFSFQPRHPKCHTSVKGRNFREKKFSRKKFSRKKYSRNELSKIAGFAEEIFANRMKERIMNHHFLQASCTFSSLIIQKLEFNKLSILFVFRRSHFRELGPNS